MARQPRCSAPACIAPATAEVTETLMGGVARKRYVCSAHEPRDIPQPPIVSTSIRPL